MLPFDPSPFDLSVKAFKAVFAAHPELYIKGQFCVTSLLTEQLVAAITSDLRRDISVQFSGDGGKSIIDGIGLALRAVPAPDLPTIKKLLIPSYLTYWQVYFEPAEPTSGDRAAVQKAFDEIWKTQDIGRLPFVGVGAPTFRLMEAAAQLERKRCFDVATGLAGKLLKARRVKPLARGLGISAGLLGLACVESVGAPSAKNQRIQNVRYLNSTAVKSAVLQMRSVLAVGGVLRCGVVSGWRDDSKRPVLPCGRPPPKGYLPDPEHYIVVLDAQDVAGAAGSSIKSRPAFLFWDPDAGHTRLGPKDWGFGFGCLFSYATPDRLSTAFDESDLVSVDVGQDPKSAKYEGDHTMSKPSEYDRRHRYQVYSVASLPAEK